MRLSFISIQKETLPLLKFLNACLVTKNGKNLQMHLLKLGILGETH